MTYDEVKSLSDEYFLPCKNVYKLYAEFNSLMSVALGEKMIEEDAGANAPEGETSAAVGTGQGIPLEFFLRTSILLKDKHPDIQSGML